MQAGPDVAYGPFDDYPRDEADHANAAGRDAQPPGTRATSPPRVRGPWS
jgi:hypothetical protein